MAKKSPPPHNASELPKSTLDLVKIAIDDPAIKNLAKAVARNCSVGASLETTSPDGGIGLATTFRAKCTPSQLTNLVDDLKGSDHSQKALDSMKEFGITDGRCGVSGHMKVGEKLTFKLDLDCP